MAADYRQYPFPKGAHPDGWKETTFGAVTLEIRSGYSSGKHNQTGQGIPHLRPMNVSPVGEIAMEDVRYVSPGVSGLRLCKDDILFTNTSSTTWVGKTAVVEQPGDWGFSNHMTRLRVAPGMSPEFVARQLHYLCISGYFSFHCKKHVNQSSVSGKQLAEEVPFRLPPSEEQKRIALKLRSFLVRERRLRDELDALPTLIQQYRAAVLDAACSGCLVPTEMELARKGRREFESGSFLLERILNDRRAKWEAIQLAKIRVSGKEPKNDLWKEKYPYAVGPLGSELPMLPEGWVWTTLQQLVEEGRPVIYGIIKPGPNTPGGVPYVRVHEMKDGTIDVSRLQRASPTRAARFARATLKAGDLLISKDGTIGKVAVVPPDLEGGNITQHLVRVSVHQFVDSTFIVHAVRSNFAQNWLTGETKGVALQGVNVEDFRKLPVPLPPRAEQERIVAEVERRFSALARIEEQVKAAIEQTSRLRVSLFHQAFSGSFVAQKKTDEPVTELLTRIRVEREGLQAKAKQQKPLPKTKMKKLSPEVVKTAISKFANDRFSFEELSASLESDYEPLKDIVFELMGEAKPSVKQVFDLKAKQMQFQRINS